MDNIKNETVVRFAYDRANHVASQRAVTHVQGYAQALWHADIISEKEFKTLSDLAEKQYKAYLNSRVR